MPYRIQNRPSGFTLLELLVVLAIVVALFAILAPAVISYQNRANNDAAKAGIKNIERALTAYVTDRGSYPTTEQGLKALIYIPLNESTYQATATTGMTQPGMTGADPMNPMAGGAAAVGPEMLGGAQPGGMMQPNPMDPTGMGAQPGGMMQPGVMDPTGMQPGGMMQPGAMDPTGMMNPAMGGAMTTGSAWTQPLSNPQLYVNARQRPDPFLDGDDVPLDPWKHPYRYDNTLLANGMNKLTGSNKPAIWSAGRDGIDGTDDDIRNWDPVVANQQLMLQQQQGTGMQTNPMDPTGMGMQPGGMMQPNPMDPTGMGGAQPGGMMQPNPMDPTGMGGVQPGGMMQPAPMNPTGMGGMQPGGMMQPPAPMPTPPPGGTLQQPPM